MRNKWTIVSSRYLLESPWIKLRQDEVELPDNMIIDDYYITERPDVAIIFGITPDDSVVFVKQYKHGVQRTTLELPAGLVDHGENALQCAKREMREETGYTSREWKNLGTFFDDASRNTNSVHPFLAHAVERMSDRTLDEFERHSSIQTVFVPMGQVSQKIADGEIQAMSSVATIYHALSYMDRGR